MIKKNYLGTPHINAKKNDFAETVLMPGDPLRAKWIAKTFLNNVKEITNIRGMLGFTGKYKGRRVSVMGSGMGIPSAGIYSYELFSYYNVKNIIRVGTCGTYNKNLDIGQILISDRVYSESTFNKMMKVAAPKGIIAGSKKLVSLAKKKAKANKINIITGLMHSSDAYYSQEPISKYIKLKINAIDMEAFALYVNARKLKKHALTICTISDNTITGKQMAPLTREVKLKSMVLLALEMVKTK